MRIKELIELLKAMPEKMEGFNSEGELVVLNTHKIAEKLKKSLRNCDVGTADEQAVRFKTICYIYPLDCSGCPLKNIGITHNDCAIFWTQMPYGEGGAK